MTGRTWTDDGVSLRVEATSSDLVTPEDQILVDGVASIPGPFSGDPPNRIVDGWNTWIGGSGAAGSPQWLAFDTSQQIDMANDPLTRLYGMVTDPIDLVAGRYRWIVSSYLYYFDDPGAPGTKPAVTMTARVLDGSTVLASEYLNGSHSDTLTVLEFELSTDVAGAVLRLDGNGPGSWDDPVLRQVYTRSDFYRIGRAPSADDWRTVTCDVELADISHGRARALDLVDIGSCSARLKNLDGQYGDQNPLRIGGKIRLSAEYAGDTFPLFFGIVDTLDYDYDPAGERLAVTVNAYDVMSIMSTTTNPGFPGGTRGSIDGWTDAILQDTADKAGYPAELIDLPGRGYVVHTDDVEQDSRTIMQTAAFSSNWDLYAERDGSIVARARTDTVPHERPIVFHAAQTVDAGDLDDADIAVCPSAFVSDRSLAGTMTVVALALAADERYPERDTALQMFPGDPADIARYGFRQWTLPTFCVYAADLSTIAFYAHLTVAGSNGDVERVRAVDYNPVGADRWPGTLSVFIFDATRFVYAHPSGVWGWATDAVVQRVAHRITSTDWTTSVELDELSNLSRWTTRAGDTRVTVDGAERVVDTGDVRAVSAEL